MGVCQRCLDIWQKSGVALLIHMESSLDGSLRMGSTARKRNGVEHPWNEGVLVTS